VHLLGARLAERSSAFVDGRARRVDVVDERQRARSGAGSKGASHVATAGPRVEPSLRPDSVRTAHERDDRHAPPACQLGRELGRRIGAAQQQAVAHRGHDGDRVDGWPRELVHHQRRRQAAG
jgi:hypothetical protein